MREVGRVGSEAPWQTRGEVHSAWVTRAVAGSLGRRGSARRQLPLQWLCGSACVVEARSGRERVWSWSRLFAGGSRGRWTVRGVRFAVAHACTCALVEQARVP